MRRDTATNHRLRVARIRPEEVIIYSRTRRASRRALVPLRRALPFLPALFESLSLSRSETRLSVTTVGRAN